MLSNLLKYLLLICVLITFISCNGQNKTSEQKESKPQVSISKQQINNTPAGNELLSKDAYAKIVKCSLRDSKGNLWFGTSWAGVYRYEGNTFTNFTTKDGLCSDVINVIFEDKEGTIWFGTENGVCRYNGNSFTTFFLPTTSIGSTFLSGNVNQTKASVSVQSILQDKASNLWFGIWSRPGKVGAFRYDGKTFTHILQENPVQGIVEDNDGGIWLNNKRFDGKSLTDYSDKPGVFKAMVFSSLKDRDGNIWFGVRDKGLYRFNGKTFTSFSKKDGLFDNLVSCIYQDKTGKLWIGCDITLGIHKGQLASYNGNSFTHYPQIYDIGVYSIWTAVEDKNGNIWFGGRGGKLCRYDGKTFTDFSGKLASNN